MEHKVVNYSEDEYQKQRHPEFINSDELSVAWSVYAFIEYFGEIKGKDILEFGGALGYNLKDASKYNRVAMIEPSPIGRKTAQANGINSYSSIEEMKISENRLFDIILCRHVLEHVHNPLEVLDDFKSLLIPGGKLILVLPCEKQSKPVKNEIDYHLYCWTPRTAINLLNVAGFDHIKWRYNYATGRRIFLFVYRRFGGKIYRWCMKSTGRILNAKEIVLTMTN